MPESEASLPERRRPSAGQRNHTLDIRAPTMMIDGCVAGFDEMAESAINVFGTERLHFPYGIENR